MNIDSKPIIARLSQVREYVLSFCPKEAGPEDDEPPGRQHSKRLNYGNGGGAPVAETQKEIGPSRLVFSSTRSSRGDVRIR